MMARKMRQTAAQADPAIDYGTGSVLAIDPRAEPAIAAQVQAGVMLAPPTGENWNYSTHDGVAVISVMGGLWTWSYARIADAIGGALADPDVARIVLDIDSPGGRVHGAGDTAELVRRAHGEKPVTAFVSGMGCSAAYLLAAAAGEIVLSESADVGCIGVMVGWLDDRDWQEKTGLKFRTLTSTQTPNKNQDINTPAGVAVLQAQLDEHARIFVDQLSRLRGVSSSVILREYGAGATYIGQQAVDQGLAERVSTLDAVVEKLQKGLGMGLKLQTGLIYRATSDTDLTPVAMTEAALREIPEAAAILDGIAAQAAEAATSATASGSTEATAKAVDDAVKAERARITGILAVQVTGAEKVCTDAIGSGATAEAVALEILRAQKDRGVSLDAMRADGTQAPHAGPGGVVKGHGWEDSVGRVGRGRK